MTVAEAIEFIQLVDKAIEEDYEIHSASVEKEGNKSVSSKEQSPREDRVTSILFHHCRKEGHQAKECKSSLSCRKCENVRQ
jgi:hypothetical protein